MKYSAFRGRCVCRRDSMMGAAQAVAQEPVSCWDYNTLSDNVGSRFGIKGALDDTILSRSAYYTLTRLPAEASAPMTGRYNSWFKLEMKAEAQGADGPLALSGLLLELDSHVDLRAFRMIKYETDARAQGAQPAARSHRGALSRRRANACDAFSFRKALAARPRFCSGSALSRLRPGQWGLIRRSTARRFAAGAADRRCLAEGWKDDD